MSNYLSNFIAAILLLIMFGMTLASILDDTFTFDEVAHVAAGYSYLTQRDYRVNPEHPPLIKDLAALPLLFLNLNFPREAFEKVNPALWWSQFDFGKEFLYKSANDPDKILFFSRLPMIFLLLFLGWFIFYWAKKMFGGETALLSLFLFSFSTTFLAQGRLVTTDVGAALGVVLSTYFWLKFLNEPNKLNLFLAGLFFGLALLIKFNLILLSIYFLIITLIWAQLKRESILRYVGLAILALILGLVFIVWPFYKFHILNYPRDLQIQQAKEVLATTGNIPKFLKDIDLFLIEKETLRPLGQFLLGLNMAINRTASGHATYFLGEISAAGWKSYFPIVYLIKEPLTFHILTLISILYAACLIKRPFWEKTFERTKKWIRLHFSEFSLLIFIGIYWLTSINSKLNIGVRHLLPVFPLTMILLSWIISNYWLKNGNLKIKYSLLGILLFWQVISVISVYPHFLAYFNELVAGPDQGYLYVVDSNLDWGQDLKRLKKWLDEKGIDKIYLDYFGGGDPEYYLKEKYLPWWGKRDKKELEKGAFLAISATHLQGGRAKAGKGYLAATDYYRWLEIYQPLVKIGYSIFVYQIN